MTPLKLPTSLLHDQANACLAEWVTQLPAALPSAVALDASALVEFDSSVLAVLLGLRRELLSRGSALRVDSMPQRLRELAALYGVMDLLQPG
jgi:phospholipid transport system transporter-binding protein